jgi:hypothetical protein
MYIAFPCYSSKRTRFYAFKEEIVIVFIGYMYATCSVVVYLIKRYLLIIHISLALYKAKRRALLYFFLYKLCIILLTSHFSEIPNSSKSDGGAYMDIELNHTKFLYDTPRT